MLNLNPYTWFLPLMSKPRRPKASLILNNCCREVGREWRTNPERPSTSYSVSNADSDRCDSSSSKCETGTSGYGTSAPERGTVAVTSETDRDERRTAANGREAQSRIAAARRPNARDVRDVGSVRDMNPVDPVAEGSHGTTRLYRERVVDVEGVEPEFHNRESCQESLVGAD